MIVNNCRDRQLEVSIIILTRNGLEYTKLCITSIQNNTDENYELIFVDNDSKDGTAQYLKTVKNSTTIENKVNRGFAGGCNQGLKIARGKYIVLLNNDTVVTKGWLTKMISWLKQDPSIGIVGPRSNRVLHEQWIRPEPYHANTLEEIEQFARIWSKKVAQKGYLASKISGLCMVFRRELINRIGGFDERFFPGNFEDVDFSIRTRISGKKLWVASDVFIHHFGNSTFEINKENHNEHFVGNRKRFLKKWNIKGGNNEIEDLIKREIPFNLTKHYISL